MKKKYSIIIIFALIFVIIIGFQVLNKSGKNPEPQAPALSESIAQAPDLETQINSEGAVEVAAAPKNLSDKEWLFEITLNTHSVELNDDLMESVVLIADNKNYKPITWDGDPAGGHHRSGILQFSPISLESKSITLKIRNIGGIEERNFTWQLSKKE